MPDTNAPRWVRPLLTLLLVASALLLLVRGPVRAPDRSFDFGLVYIATRAWLQGENPYRYESLLRTWQAAPGVPEEDWTPDRLFAVYPPSTFVVMAPWAAMPYPAAKVGWAVFNAALVPALILAAVALAGLSWRDPRALVLAIGVCLLAPLQTGFAVGQVALMATTLIVAALAAERVGRWPAAAVALGLATALKPQMGLVFVGYLIWRLRGRAAAGALGAAGLCLLLGVWQLQRGGHDWLNDMRAALHAFTTTGPGDPTPANPNGWQLINLHHPLHQLGLGRDAAGLVTWAVVGAAGVSSLLLATRRRHRCHELAFLGCIATLSLLLVYHRLYDAALLVLPWAWVVRCADLRRVGLGWVTAATLLAFVVSGPAALNQLVVRGYVGEAVAETWWWRLVLMPHHVWALCVLAGAMLLAQRRADRDEPAAPGQA